MKLNPMKSNQSITYLYPKPSFRNLKKLSSLKKETKVLGNLGFISFKLIWLDRRVEGNYSIRLDEKIDPSYIDRN